jgi:hypothetical protein
VRQRERDIERGKLVERGREMQRKREIGSQGESEFGGETGERQKQRVAEERTGGLALEEQEVR